MRLRIMSASERGSLFIFNKIRNNIWLIRQLRTVVTFSIILISIIMLAGDLMRNSIILKKTAKGLVSLLLVLTVMVSLLVPFEVHAEEAPAMGSEIYALLYDNRTTATDNNWGGYELVIQKGSTADPDITTTDASQGLKRRVLARTYSYSQFGSSSLSMTNDQVKGRTPWYQETPKSSGWDTRNKNNTDTSFAKLITKITIKDKIAPESIASWFYYCDYATEINNLDYIVTSNCTDMRYAFYSIGSVRKLDLHTFDTSKVEKIDYFIYSSNALEEVDVSGFDLSSVQTLNTFIKGGYKASDGTYKCCKLSKVNFSGMNIENIREIQYFLTFTNDLEEIDFDLNPRNVKDFMYAFQYNRGLKKFKLGTQGHPFQPGIDYQLDYRSGENKTYNRLVRLNGMFEGCVSLEEIDFTYTDMPEKLTDGKDSQYLDHSRHYEYASFFKNCSSLTTLTNLDNLFLRFQASGNYIHRSMFDGCSSLETLDLSKIHGMLGGPWIFRGCSSLRTLDLRNLGTDFDRHNWNVSNGLRFQATDNGADQNIYEGCDELSEVYLSPYYPPANKYFYDGGNYIGHGITVPPVEREWVKVNLPEDYYDGDWNDFTNTHTYNKREYTSSRVKLNTLTFSAKNDSKDTSALFESFEPELAGRWVAVSNINLRGNGGSPAKQSIEGAIDMPITYEDGDITEPTRNGYHFEGWYSEKENGEGEELQKNQPAASWTYYAHWSENHYTLKLNGNGGTTVKDGATVTEYVADDNLGYDDFFELNNKMFTKDGYVLSGWSTTPAGSGQTFTANDSVNKLAEVDGGSATLYAQWHKPDFILHLSANYDGASSIPDRNYTIVTGETTYYGALPEATRDGYTFMGWYTAHSGGTKVESTDELNLTYDTLYAHWEQNPTIHFNANGTKVDNTENYTAYFDDDPTKNIMSKVYNYGDNLGVLPTPQKGSATLIGWFTEADGGTQITSNTTATANNVYYYAHWGYQPQFESNGGVYDDTVTFPTYSIQSSASYTISALPAFKDETGFEGWYHGETQVHAGDTVDLSENCVIEARWANKNIYEITLDAGSGSFKSGTIGATSPIKVYAGSAIGEIPTPTREDYDFLGWYTAASGGDLVDYHFVPSGSCTLYARWEQKKYTVTFDPGDGTLYDPDHNASVKVRENGCVTALPGANRDGYSLDGWYYNDNGTETLFTANTAVTSAMVDGENKLACTAKWTKAEDRFIESGDGYYKYAVKWFNSSNEYLTNIGDNLFVAPSNGNSSLSVTLYIQMNFDQALLGTNSTTIPSNAIQIKIPKYVFKNSSGQGVGYDNISYGLSTVDTANSDFIYEDKGDYYLIKNNDAITNKSANQNQVFKIDYSVSAADLRTIDGGYADENGYYAGTYYQRAIGGTSPNDPLQVQIQVDRDNDEAFETNYTKELGLEVHTDVSTSAWKSEVSSSFEWKDAWGDKPADAEQYFYMEWELSSSHDTKSSQQFKVQWDESTVHDGSVVYMSPSGQSDYKSSGTFKTKVVTKHSKKVSDSGWKTVHNEAILTVEWLSGYTQQFRVGKDAGVYLVGGKTPELFGKYVEQYKKTGGDRFKKGGQDLILNGTGVSNLRYDVEYYEYQSQLEDDYASSLHWYEATKTYSVPEREIVITDGAKGDLILSTVKGSAPYDWHAAGSALDTVLSDSDYSFTDLEVFLTEYDAVQVSHEEEGTTVKDWSEPYVHTAVGDYGSVEVWTRAEGDSDYILFKTLKTSDFVATADENNPNITDYDRERGAAMASVTLPAGTAGYKLRHKSTFFTTKLFTNVGLDLKASNKVLSTVREDVAGGYNSLIKNNATLTLSASSVGFTHTEQSKDMKTTQSYGKAYPSSYELSIGESYIYASKQCISRGENDGNVKPFYTITGTTEEFPVVISGWGYNDMGHTKLLDSGVFNDLLPYNFTVDRDSVYVQLRTDNVTSRGKNANQYNTQMTDENVISKGYYDIAFTEDWEGSGRTMMTITVNVPEGRSATGFNVFYKMNTPISNISANGTSQSNYVSFTDTTLNQSVPKAKYSSLNSLDKSVIPYYKSIDDEFTAYASDRTDLVEPVQYATGIKSFVETDGEFQFKDQTVGLNSEYVYNVTFTNGEVPASNIIVYDVIETSLKGLTYDWEGEIKDIVISSIGELESNNSTESNKIYCAPVLYYCTKTSGLTKDDLDLVNHPELWTTTRPENLDDVRAIAIDCRADTANSAGGFVLPADKSISFDIMMHAPQTPTENDIYTYNEAIVSSVVNNEPFTNSTLISVLLHYADPEFHKTSFPASGEYDEDTDTITRTGVVYKSTIRYSLAITNPDADVSIHDIVVEDVLDSKLVINDTAKVKIGEETPVDIGSCPHISNYEVAVSGGVTTFTATVVSLAKGETITIIIPATVNAGEGDIDNTARITSISGIPANIQSETTYHYITESQAKIKKVNSKGEGLAGATLELYEQNSTNCNADGTLKMTTGDNPVPSGTPKTVTIGGNDVTSFTSTADLITFNLEPGDYILHEVSAPGDYKKAADIPFKIDEEGISHVGGESVDYVEMVDQPKFKIIFHENKPGGTDEEKQKEFKIYENTDLVNKKISHFYDIPEWAGDEYVFAGWYCNGNTTSINIEPNAANNSYATTAVNFETKTYNGRSATAADPDYHIYAKWIAVGTVKKDTTNDTNDYGKDDLRGFGLEGVQIRNPKMNDPNYNDDEKPGGLRFVTSMSKSLYDSIDALSSTNVDGVPVEYGYVVGTEANINIFIGEGGYNVKNHNQYKLQYKGENVNGVNTTGETRTAETDYRYITNVNCTSRVGGIDNGIVNEDHRNFTNYRLYTLVVTYEGADASKKAEKLDARAYIRYYDANGKLRVFYNEYKKNAYHGGCMCSFDQVSAMAAS